MDMVFLYLQIKIKRFFRRATRADIRSSSKLIFNMLITPIPRCSMTFEKRNYSWHPWHTNGLIFKDFCVINIIKESNPLDRVLLGLCIPTYIINYCIPNACMYIYCLVQRLLNFSLQDTFKWKCKVRRKIYLHII